MTVKNDLTNLSDYWRGRILRISRKILRRHLNVHTIIIGRKKGAENSCEFLDFQFFVFLDEERDLVTGEKRTPSVHFGEDEVIVSEKYTVYEPGMGYKNITGCDEAECECVCDEAECNEAEEMVSVETHGRASECDEVDALHYEFGRVTPELRQNYLEYLNTHCQLFVCSDFPKITTLNMMEMKRDDTRFFRFYLTGKFDKGYLVYNREMKPMPSLK